jgi:ADP-ribose pyrophosphatase
MKKVLYENPFFKLVDNDNYFNIEYRSEHAGVVIIPEVDDKIVFVKNYRKAIDQFSWELPRGAIDPGETFIQAAMRELKEETSFKSKEKQLTHIGFTAPDTTLANNKMPIFHAQLKASDETKEELDSEISEYVFVSKKELSKWVLDNVVDGITLSALYIYQLQKG